MDTMKRKIPWLAALLNFFIPGAGYIYVGTRLRFGVLLVAATVLTVFAPSEEVVDTETALAELEEMIAAPGFVTMLIASLLIMIAFAYDAWGDAKRYNEALAESVDPSEE